MEQGYRVPKEEEFVQGFQFEIKVDSIFRGYRFLDGTFSSGPSSRSSYWTEMEVWWLRTEPYVQMDGEGNRWTIMPNHIMDCPIDIKQLIKEEKVRVKL